MKKFKATFGLTKEEVSYHLHVLPYYRLYFRTKDALIELSKKVNRGEVTRNEHVVQKQKMRDALNNLWRELNESI